MSCLSKMKHFFALILTIALLIIPNTDFSIKVSAAENSPDSKYNLEYYSEALSRIAVDIYEDACSVTHAEVVDQVKMEAEKQIRIAKVRIIEEYKAKAQARVRAQEEAKAKAEEERVRAEEEAKAKLEAEAKAHKEEAELKAAFYNAQTSAGFLIPIDNPDYSYTGRVVNVTGYDRYILEHLVMGEAGNQGFTGMALVAQSIRDRMVYDGYTSVDSVRVNCGYYGSIDVSPSDEALSAVSYIFDQGGCAIQHTVRYFYAYTWSSSSWHETLNYVVTYKDHKFFDKW